MGLATSPEHQQSPKPCISFAICLPGCTKTSLPFGTGPTPCGTPGQAAPLLLPTGSSLHKSGREWYRKVVNCLYSQEHAISFYREKKKQTQQLLVLHPELNHTRGLPALMAPLAQATFTHSAERLQRSSGKE